ncbi:MAG: CBS domain-containing protein, partial [Verrucomicrobiales bacterium]|nr:CBS domain-containing protein [Verrucomicrobiales bacterium]
ITLLPIGGVARLERIPSNPRHELVIAIAGPLVNVVLAAAIAAFLYLSHQSLLPSWRSGWYGFAQRLLMVNVSLVAFNLLPAFPMDGGRILRAALAMAMDPVQATRIAAYVGRGMAILFAGFALYSGNYLLLFIALFIWMGAGGEARAAEMRAATGGVRARDAMRTQFVILNASDSIASALRQASGGSQTGFPVVEDGRLLGVTLRSDLQDSAARLGDATAVGRIVRDRLVVVAAEEPVTQAIPRIQASGIPVALVTQEGRLVGMLELDDLR